MRIIGGQYKGFRFDAPANIPARPTTDRSKESLINILLSGDGIEGLECLDLFSGTGNIAYELASQGAASITAVDINNHAVKFIAKTFEQLHFVPVKILRADVIKWLKQYSGKGFDLVFADPPYELKDMGLLPQLIFEKQVLRPDGLLVIEHRNTFNFTDVSVEQVRTYGQSHFTFFRHPSA